MKVIRGIKVNFILKMQFKLVLALWLLVELVMDCTE